MKKKIIIESSDGVVFKGKMMNMPIKKSSIIEKSIELFDDDDPCIIHTSYVIKHFADDLSKLFDEKTSIQAKDYPSVLSFLDVDDLNDITISLKR